MSFISELLIFIGGFLGVFCGIIIKYGVRSDEFKKFGTYVVALVLSSAVYGMYYYLSYSGLIPSGFSLLALFGFAVFVGFALQEIARGFVSLVKKTD